MHRPQWRPAAALLLLAAACRPQFQPAKFATSDALYQAGLREFQRKHWENAVAAFEKLTVDLSPRDTLLPRSYWYLATAHEKQGEHLLAAQSYSRLVESFPENQLADSAALESARSYKKLWRRPNLDATYGETALAAYGTLLTLFPSSTLVPVAQREMAQVQDWLAQKSYETGRFYLRRKAYDSAIIYLKSVLEQWPDTPTARSAGLELVQAYHQIRYREDEADLCTQLRRKYAGDHEVVRRCSGIADVAPPTAPPAGQPSSQQPPASH